MSKASSNSSSSSYSFDKDGKPKQSKSNYKKSWFKMLTLRGKRNKLGEMDVAGTSEFESNLVNQNNYLNKVSENWMNPNFVTHSSQLEESPSLQKFALNVTSNLTLISRSPIKTTDDLLNHLELFIDHYSGSQLMYPYYSLIYILLGAKLRSTDSTSSLFTHKSEFSGILKLGTFHPNLHLQMGKFNLRMSEGRGKTHCSIVLDINLAHSNRSGKTYPEWYQMGDNNYPFTSAVDLFKLNLAIDEDGILGPV